MRKKFSVEGMMCAACQSNVEKMVRALPGVDSVNVSLLSKSMIVDYDPEMVNEEKIENIVARGGYACSIFVNESIVSLQRKKEAELKKKKNKLIWSWVSLALLMVFSMTPMFLGDSFMQRPDYIPLMIGDIAFQLLFVIPVIVLDFDLVSSGIKALFHGKPNMQSLVSCGMIASLAYGLYSFVMTVVYFVMGESMKAMPYTMNIYVESAGMILCFVSLGKYLESRANQKMVSSVASLMELVPETALKVEGEEVTEVSTDSLSRDDIVSVRPGSSVPTDGFLISDVASLNESALSGESKPVDKKKDDKVVIGTINVGSAFLYRVSETGKDTTMGKIITLVEEASASKAPLARIADKAAGIFCPAVMVLSLLVFILWEVLTGLGIAGTSTPDTNLAFQLAISVLVVSCPCALGLATPLAVLVGGGKGAEQGILIKSAEAFERLSQVDVVLFDKTGTLTEGKMKLVDSVAFKGNVDSSFRIAANMEGRSEHPISKAFLAYAKENNVPLSMIEGVETITGKGLYWEGWLVGNETLFQETGSNLFAAKEYFNHQASLGRTVVFFGDKHEVFAAFAFADTLKENAQKSVKALQNIGKKVVMVTGDHHLVAQEIAKELDVDEVFDSVLPQGKEGIVSHFQKEGKKVAFVGDGINDAPALTRADVGLAIGAGTDVAIDSADVVLVKSDPLDVVESLRLSRRVVRNIKENLLWAFFYNLLLIPLAAGAFYGVKVPPNWFTGEVDRLVLTPMISSLAMSLSSITVVLNALRLRRYKRKG